MNLLTRKIVLTWLYLCAGLVFAMVLVGGVTRLTESGLSIVEWKPFTGILPPIGQTSWEAEFAAYKTSPQYQKVNQGMSLADFQGIFWLEYLHRLLGRLVGMVFLVPLLFFSVRKNSLVNLPRMWLIATLVGLQGLVGWYMVKSGLVDIPAVSPYRLGLHLGLAELIFALVLWEIFRLTKCTQLVFNGGDKIKLLAQITTFSVVIQMFLGALVAGLRAGLTYNSFPLMDGDFIPHGIFIDHIATAQFFHRWFAFLAAALVLSQAAYLWRINAEKLALALILIVTTQISLGIATLLLAVPVALASIHQVMAFILLGFCLRVNYIIAVQPKLEGK